MSSPRVNGSPKGLKRKSNDSAPGGLETKFNEQIIEISSEDDEIEDPYVTADESEHDKGDRPPAKDAEAETRTAQQEDNALLEKMNSILPPNSDDDELYDPSELRYVSRVKYHSREDWPWLLEVNAYARDPDRSRNAYGRYPDGSRDARVRYSDRSSVGECSAKLVDRDAIRSDFYWEMEGPTQELWDLALILFDRWGNLRPDFISHPINKGTGVWGKELNQGSLLCLENIKVKRRYHRRGLGRWMLQQVIQKALAADSTCHFAIARPVFIDQRNWNERPSFENSDKPENIAYLEAGQRATEDFWRSMGFRRIGSSAFFAFAMVGDHPSLHLDKANDYVRPSARSKTTGEGPLYPVDDSFMKADDQGTVRKLKQRARALPPNDKRWFATDANGRNVMHIVASSAKPRALAFLKRIPPGNNLSSTRDLAGHTPLEHLQQKLENVRLVTDVWGITAPAADEFEGHSDNEVACLAVLTNTPTTDSIKMARLRFGCTCGECLGGFLSPRLVASLLSASREYRDLFYGFETFEIAESGPEWCATYGHLLTNLHEPVRRNLGTNKSMRRGFEGLYMRIAETLATHKRVPTTSFVLGLIDRQWPRQWPPTTMNFIRRGGTVTAVALNFFDHAIEADRYLGDNSDDESDLEDESVSLQGIQGATELKECRNDREFVFARRQYLRTEGFPIEYPHEDKHRFG